MIFSRWSFFRVLKLHSCSLFTLVVLPKDLGQSDHWQRSESWTASVKTEIRLWKSKTGVNGRRPTQALHLKLCLCLLYIPPSLMKMFRLFYWKELLNIPCCLLWWYCNTCLEYHPGDLSSEVLPHWQLHLHSDKQNEICSLGSPYQKNPQILASKRTIKLIFSHLFWLDSKIQGFMQLKPAVSFNMPLVWQ